jgi:hypothetical protein
MKLIKILVLASVFWGGIQGIQAQSPAINIWKILAKLTYQTEYNEELEMNIEMPIFSSQITALEGKIVEVRGYIIPLEGYKSHQEFVFSAFPYSMCFFCGGAGPETVMEVEAKHPIVFTNDPITLKGVLHLNGSDINRLMYILKDATYVSK